MSWITTRRAAAVSSIATSPRRLIEVAPGGAVAALSRAHASDEFTPRALEIEALLHLPRLAGADGALEADRADEEVARLGRRLRLLYAPARGLARAPALTPTLADIRLDVVEETTAASVARHLHYLHSPRSDSLHFGSYTSEGRLVALVSLSVLDLATVASTLPLQIEAEEALVVSRVFAFDWAPRNTISHLLGQVERRLREARPEIRLLLTYVNPNLGFDGASYRAANWSLFAHEVGTRYGYLDGDYVTDREIERLPELDQGRVVYSVMPLAPLRIFARLVRRRDRREQIVARVVPRP